MKMRAWIACGVMVGERKIESVFLMGNGAFSEMKRRRRGMSEWTTWCVLNVSSRRDTGRDMRKLGSCWRVQ